MKALLIVLLVLLLLGLLKVGVHFVWDGSAAVQLLIWKLRISFPGKKKPEKEASANAPFDKSAPKKMDASLVKGWLAAALSRRQDILTLIGRAIHTPRIDVLILRLTAGGQDAADCALNYGKLWAAVSGMLPVLENTFRIGKREIEIWCDYEKKETSCFAQADLTVRIYELLALGILGLKLLVQLYHEYKMTQKAVQSS